MSEQRMRLATEATGVGIWEWNVITDKIRWDAMMFLIYGIAPTPDGVVQYSDWREAVLPEDLDKQETVLRNTVQRLGSSSRNFRIKRRNDGQCRVIDCVETVRTNEKGEAEWVVGTNLDVTDRKRAELELVESKRKLDLAMQVGGMGAWSLDIQTQNLRGDAILLNLFGFETTTSPSLDQYFNRIHCDDRDRVSRAVTDAIENGSTYDQEFRIDLPNGGVRWVRSYAQNFPSSQGSAKEFTGITYDVTDRKLRELDFADREAHLRRVINNQLGLVGVIDRDGILLEVDDRSLAIAKARREEVIGKHFADAPWWNYDPAVAQQMRAAMRRAFDGDVVRYDVSLFANGDEGVMIDFMIAPVINDLGEVEFLIPSGVDIRERHAAELVTRESERLVRQNEEKFRVMADGLPSLIWVHDAEGNYLLEIINDILDLSKIEAGKLELNREPFDPVRVVEDVRSIMNVRASENHLQLNVHYEGKLPRQIESDPKRLNQILINLVGNAIKFTKKGHVDIVVRFDRGIGFQPVDDNNVKKNRLEANPTLQFEIIDSGVGMSSEQQAKLFKPFTQGDSSISRHFGGTGLGLAISRRLATMLGGDIAAESKLGEGSKFSVVIQTGSIHDVEFTEPQLAIKAPPPASPTVDQNSLDCSVLVVDDRRDIRFLSKRILTNAGATVDECEEGMLAVEHITDRMTRNQCPDLILLDMQMPNLDGYQTARKLRELGYTGPIIALTADAMQGDMNQCLNAGCNDYLSKPIVAKRLVDLVAELTRSEPVQ